ncbi:MAG: acetate--CoA ligase family protein [Deltaproteobacteria bacterium]
MTAMNKMFYPESVLIYGISDSPTNLAKYTLMNLEAFGFQGKIQLFGTKEGLINGRKICTSFDEIEGTPDLATILVPAKRVPQALEDCGKKGIKFAVIQTGGFSEFASEGSALENQMIEIANRYGMRFAGPNCIGLINIDNGLVEPFFPIDPHIFKKGIVSFIAQSGGIAMDALRFLDTNYIGFNKLFSIGNKLNVNESDYLSFLIEDEKTKAIGLYLEGFSDGRKFLEIASQSTKPIACLKSNRVAISRQIASFHTTALAGDDIIADVALKQAGVFRAQTMSEMMEFFKLSQMPQLQGNRIGVICRSGGQAVTFADAVGLHGFELADFSQDLFDLVTKRVRAGVIRLTNPLDLGDVLDTEFYIQIMEKAVAEPDVDGLVFGHVYLNELTIPETEEFMREAQRISWQYNKPVMIYIVASKDHYFRLRVAADFPIFTDENKLFHVLKEMYQLNMNKAHGQTKLLAKTPLTAKAQKLPQGFLPPQISCELLKKYDLSFPPYAVVQDGTQALVSANTLGYPVALKIADAEVLHKTEKKGVILDIKNDDEMKVAVAGIEAKSLLVQKMTQKGIECFIGAKKDAEFGSVIFFGMGGIFVELIKDIAIRIAPIDKEQAKAMIAETKVARLLNGFRNLPAGDIDALADALAKVSLMMVENPEIVNLDINPIMVFPAGQGCAIVDVKIEVE